MKKIVTLVVAICALHTLSAQDLHFAQTAQTPLLINPAAAGVFDGWERAIINHRNQWLGAGTQFMTTNIAVDANIWKAPRNDQAHMGVGLLFYNDIGGDSKFGNQSGALTVSGILPVGSGSTLSAGVQGGFGQRKADLSGVSFLNQWDGAAFDPTIISGEANTVTSFTYMDASAGLYYVYDGGQSTFSRNNKLKIQVGIAGYHLNKPLLKYMNGSTDQLHRKFVGHLGFVTDIAGSKFAVDGSAVQFWQGGHFETLIGTMIRYRFENGTKITGLSQNAFFGFGVYTRLKDAIIPSVMIEWQGFQFGMSYDVTLSALRKAYRGGSLEFSLSYVNKHHALFKTKKRRM
ncbi:MAG: type IX secretion system PorP/SprF family membrane protein [Flavobacteriaceae bacterium]|jgi:type IX secretion system PorP/SprF family membrane protein